MDRRRHHERLVAVLGWVLAGALAGVGLLGILTVGIVLLATAGLLAAVLVSARLGREWGSGALLGLATATAFLAWTNRRGPGRACVGAAGEQSCAEYYDPRPWALATVVLVALAVAVYLRSGARVRAAAGRPSAGRTPRS